MTKKAREAAERAFYECDGNTQVSLKAALDAYEAAKAKEISRPVIATQNERAA